jgi:hypothetical protein
VFFFNLNIFISVFAFLVISTHSEFSEFSDIRAVLVFLGELNSPDFNVLSLCEAISFGTLFPDRFAELCGATASARVVLNKPVTGLGTLNGAIFAISCSR